MRLEFRHNRLALFDEMNVGQIRKHVQKLYKNINKIIKQEFLKLANEISEEIYDEAVALGFDGDMEDLDEAWIEEFFEEYNPVTKYVFKNEIGRKESRLFESLVANEVERLQSYAYAERLMKTQVRQYSLDLEDATTMAVYKALGIKEVTWVAEHDHKTCGVCNELDGQVFDIAEVPPKQHYNCRCYLVPKK